MEAKHYQSQRGFTLAELLVAIVVLLVGVYAVVAGFPRLRAVIEDDKIRSRMTRAAQEMLQGWPEASVGLPFAVTYSTSSTAGLDPEQMPDQNVANPRDDQYQIIGESFRLMKGSAASAHVLRMGPANSSRIMVYEIIPLERAPNPLDPLRPDQFRVLDADLTTGVLDVLPPDLTDPGMAGRDLVVDYAWVDLGGRVHYTQGELLAYDVGAARYQVAAAALSGVTGFVQLLPERVRVAWRNYFWQPGASATDGDVFALGNHNTTLTFSTDVATRDAYGNAASERDLLVDYELALETPGVDLEDRTAARAPLIMVEDHQVPAAPNGQVGGSPVHLVKLTTQFLDDSANPLGFGPGIHVYAVDLATGAAYDDTMVALNIQAPEGFEDGEVYFTPGSAPVVSGHRLRFYYRTLDDATLRLLRAPGQYADSITRSPVAPPGTDSEDYRRYVVTYAPAVVGDPTTVATLTFPAASAGQTVEVDYELYDGRAVTGEIHNLPLLPSGADPLTFRPSISLRVPGVASVRSVRGVSVRAVGYWRSHNGNLHKVEIESYLTNPPRA